MPSKDTKTKKPYSLWKLLNWWLLALFWGLLIFPIFLVHVSIGRYISFTVLLLIVLVMIIYTIHFLRKRKQLTEQRKQVSVLKNHKEEGSKKSFLWSLPWTITLLVFIASVVLSMRTPPGLSITGTMFWDGEPAATVSVILCPAGTLPGPSFFGIGGGCDEKSVPWTIIDASGEYRFFNIPSGQYRIFYKWPDEDDWKLGGTTKESYLVFAKERGITKVDPIAASREDWFVFPKEILDYPSVISTGNQEITFKWNPLKDAEYYSIGIFGKSETEQPGETIFFDTVTSPVIKVLLPEGKLSLGIRAYNLKKELIGKGWYYFEVKE